MIATKPDVETFQTPFELDQMVALFDTLGAGTVLEIGAWQGGSLWHWLQGADTVVVVDDRMQLQHEWQQWAFDAGSTLELVPGRSGDADVVSAVRDLGPYDFVFVDADHTYESVSADWANYRPMVSDGGVFAFHDIIERPGYGVSQLWSEIKSLPGTRWVEINETVEAGNETRHGIGIVWL